jgi:hypothetical protein
MKNKLGQSRYSRTVQLSANPDIFSFVYIINPFSDKLVFEVVSDHNGKATAGLIDVSGKTIKRSSFDITTGVNHLVLDNTEKLAYGIYFLRVQSENIVLQKKVMKMR